MTVVITLHGTNCLGSPIQRFIQGFICRYQERVLTQVNLIIIMIIVVYGTFNCSNLKCFNIQIIHSSEGISKNYPHMVPLEQSNTPEAVAKGVWTVFEGTECG